MTCARCGSEGFGCYECTPDPFAIIARLTADRDAWSAESADNRRNLVEATARIDAMRDDIITLGAQVNSLMRERDAALAQVVQAATLPSRYGAARIQTVQRDFNALRAAIRAHDSEAAETAWDRCERWLGLWPLEQTTPPAPAPSTPVDNKISADPVGKEG